MTVRGADPRVAALQKELAKHGTAERRIQSKRYLKSDLAFLGTSVPAIRRTAKAFVRAHPGLSRRELRELAERLWATDVHELRSVAIGILELSCRELTAADAKWLIALVRTADTWAHVDWLATKVLGPLAEREPKLGVTIDLWAADQNFWVRRTALLVFHDALLRGEGDFDHFARLAAGMLEEREFFIRKAIGWVLRSTARRTPERTITFVEEHAAEMAALSFKEATRVLPARDQKRLVALRAARA